MKTIAISYCLLVGVVTEIVTAVRWELASVRARRYYNLTNTGDIDSLTLASLKTVLELDQYADLREYDRLITAQGAILVRLAEEYDGSKVRGSQLDVCLKTDGRIDRLGGRVTQGMSNALIDLESACLITKTRLLNKALARQGLTLDDVIIQRKRVTSRYIIKGDGEPVYVAFLDVMFVIKATRTVVRKVFKMDACAGSVMDVQDRLTTMAVPGHTDSYQQTVPRRRSRGHGNRNQGRRKRQRCSPLAVGVGGNKRLGQVHYGIEPHCLNVTFGDNGTCVLMNDFIKVIDLKNGTGEDIRAAVEFDCETGYDDAINGAISPAIDAFYHATQWAQMFRDWYSYAPLSNHPPRAFVHFGGMVDNAFWDGQNVLLGDGGPKTFPYTALDIVAHELAHGITERTSELELMSESGAIAESFSDAVGEVAEAYLHGANDWIVGAELFKEEGNAVRYFRDPSRDGASINHILDYTKDMKVHYASGLFNRVFYYISQRLGVRRALEAFLVANRIYWHETTDFEEGACKVIKGAYDAGLDMELYKRAFEAIGLKLTKCKDFSEFVLPITDTERRDNLRISRVTQPLFQIVPPDSARGFSVTVYSNADTKITISSSYSRSYVDEITSAINRLTFDPDPRQTVYIRLQSREPEDRPASVYVAFY